MSSASSIARAAEGASTEPVEFVRDVQPIFAAHCHECHGPRQQEGGLRLHRRSAALAGGDSGQQAIVPSDPDSSRLLKVIGGTDPDLKMPPEGEGEPLTSEQVELIARWIREGAAWPESAGGAADEPTHWAWQKPGQAPLPRVEHAAWPRRPLDYFVLARLEQAKLAPAPEADRYTLARRLWLDLVGLPPTPEEVERFVHDERFDAYEQMVDRALADPAYGERWARVWLDLARYADSKGYGSDPLRTIWRYRDWVIEAFNRNLPYDRFTIEQLAGDLLPDATSDQLLATAFHRNTMANDEGGTDDEEFRVAAVKDRIETTMQVWMGLTMGCAKCHSHKFDPITQREYYQAYAIFNQTEDADRGDEEPKLATPTRIEKQRIAECREQLARIEQQLATPPAIPDDELARWEHATRDRDTGWVTLEPTEFTTTEGAKLELLPDRSLLATGESPATTTYRIVAPTTHAGVTAFRLDALPHEGLPAGGPGRAGGNFVLSEFQVHAGVHPAGPPQGRYVRIEIPGDEKMLSLAEVQVFADDKNIGPEGQATQSSTVFGAAASRAIDNKTSGDFDQGSVTHTNGEQDPRWELDLGRAAPLTRVVIWNRTDHGLESRLADFDVTVLDADHKPLWRRRIADPPKPTTEIDLTEPTQLELVEATSDFAQAGFDAAQAIDNKLEPSNGWAVSPRVGQPRHAVFRAKQPLDLPAPTSLSFTLTQAHGGGHALGRFRLSVTLLQPPPAALPQPIHDILATNADYRTAEQRSELVRYYWTQSAAAEALRSRAEQLIAEIGEIEKQIAATPVLRELPADKRRTTHTMVKGNFRAPGAVVEPAVPAAFHALSEGAKPDRLGLALWLVDADNPLTARVAVNRFWSRLFGAGLVASEEDFGTQGLPPTHPAVLDWLAVEFRTSGWDMKHLLREIVCSATYRQASTPASEALERDPQNLLLAHGPRHRLEAEVVRDQALAISGLLTRKLGGPSVYPPQPPGLWRAAFNSERNWATSEGEDRYRRGLYTYWRRTVPYPSMAAFDAPSREICTLRRIPTNTPLQAFVTLNDPVYVEAAQALARRMVAEAGPDARARSAHGLRLALARPPQPRQIDELVELYQDALETYRHDLQAAAHMATEPLGSLPAGYDVGELAAWTVVANVLLNLDGVLTKR